MLAVLRLPGLRSLFACSCLGRLPMGALGLLMSLEAVLLTCSATVLAGDWLFSFHPVSRGWRPPDHADRHLRGFAAAAVVRASASGPLRAAVVATR